MTEEAINWINESVRQPTRVPPESLRPTEADDKKTKRFESRGNPLADGTSTKRSMVRRLISRNVFVFRRTRLVPYGYGCLIADMNKKKKEK